jgi:hypothetical protein
LGGFTEDYDVGTQDHEFFARAVLKGARLEVVPEELFWYRRQQGSMIQTTPPAANVFLGARPYLEALSPDLRGIVRLLQGYHHLVVEGRLPALQAQHGLVEGEFLAIREHYTRKFEEYWNSWSWRSFRPIRNFIRRCRGLAPECKPQIDSISDAVEAINSIKNSATWHVTRLLRVLRKLVKRCFP